MTEMVRDRHAATGILGWLTRELAGSFLIGAELTASNSRPCDRSMWLPGLRTFQDPNRPLSKSSLRCVCCTIFWSFGKSHHRIRHIPCVGQSMWSKRQDACLEPRRRQNAPGVDSQGFSVRLTRFGAHRGDVLQLRPSERSTEGVGFILRLIGTI